MAVKAFEFTAIKLEIIKTCVATAPSGANTQPWFFAIVTDPLIKKQIRKSAEIEELKFYTVSASEDFLQALEPLKTNWQKNHLEEASALIIIFSKKFNTENEEQKNAIPTESVGTATGMLISALHLAVLATLSHAPNPMYFPNRIPESSPTDKPFLIQAVGRASATHLAANILKKGFDEICAVD